MKKVICLIILPLLFSCVQEEIWVLQGAKDKTCRNTISIKEKSIVTQICCLDDASQKFIPKIINYSIIEKIKNDKDSMINIYFLKNETDDTFTVLPEMKINGNIRKFDTHTLASFKYKETELKAYLFDSLFPDGKGNKIKGIYFTFGSAKKGYEFKRK